MPIQVVQTRHGPMMVEALDKYVGRSLIELGEYAEGQVECFRHIVQPGMTVVEVGANIGAHTIPLARMAREVVAFEAQRHVYHMLCGNVALNGLTNVRCFHVAAGAEERMLEVPTLDTSVENNLGAFSVELQGETRDRVRMIKVEVPCHFLKIDVEGYESEVLKGAEAMIRECQPTIYLENDRLDKADALIEQVRAMGYTPYWHLTHLQRRTNFNGTAKDVFGIAASFDMICAPASVTVEDAQEAKPGDLRRMMEPAHAEVA